MIAYTVADYKYNRPGSKTYKYFYPSFRHELQTFFQGSTGKNFFHHTDWKKNSLLFIHLQKKFKKSHLR